MIKLDVPVTLTFGNLKTFPISPFFAEILIYPFFKLYLAPKHLKPAI